MATYSDNFNIANEDPLSNGGNWAGAYTDHSWRTAQVVSNQVEPDTVSTATAQSYTGSFGNDQFAQIDVANLGGVSMDQMGVLLRFTAPTNASGYLIDL